MNEVNQHMKRKQTEIDDAVLRNTNKGGAFFFALLLCVLLGVSLSAVLFNEMDSNNSAGQWLLVWGASLLALLFAAFTVRGLKSTTTNDLLYFEKEYRSGERTPTLAWQYSGDRWGEYAKQECKMLSLSVRLTILLCIALVVAVCAYFGAIVTASIIAWITIAFVVFYFVNGRKNTQIRLDAYLNTKPATLDIYDRGVMVGKMHYIPFNTRNIWLKSASVIDNDGTPYLEFATNVRAGKYPDANVTYIRVPIPEGKEQEANNYVAQLAT